MKLITKTKTYLYFTPESKKNFMKWLVDQEITLGKIADMLDISSTYLSLVLNGQREVTMKLKEKLEELGYEFQM